MTNAKTIEEYFGTLQQSMVEAWKEHLKTDKYSAHIALNEFYDDIVDMVDNLIEHYQGEHGKVGDLKNLMSTEKIGAIQYLTELAEFAKAGRDQFFKEDSGLCSDVDDILGCINSTLYKLKELKESRLSLVDYIRESLQPVVEEEDTIKSEKDLRAAMKAKFEKVFGDDLDKDRMKKTIDGFCEDHKKEIEDGKFAELIGEFNESFANNKE